MILVTRRDVAGQPVAWLDLDARVEHDTTSGTDRTRAFTEEENGVVDALVAAVAAESKRAALRTQLADGITTLTGARQQAAADVTIAQDLNAAALAQKAATTTQRQQVVAFVPSVTYKAADLAAVRDQIATILDRMTVIQQAMADMYAYRAAVDQNAVSTDDALLWLARLAAGLLDDQTA